MYHYTLLQVAQLRRNDSPSLIRGGSLSKGISTWYLSKNFYKLFFHWLTLSGMVAHFQAEYPIDR